MGKARPTPPARAEAGNAGRARAREGRRREAPGGSGITGTDNGELLAKVDTATGDTTTFAYDAVGNLRGVGLPNGDLLEYLVDGRGRRVGKRVNGVLERGWLWRGQLQPVAELDGAGNVVARFVYAGGVNVPALIVTPSATYRLVTDHLGSVRRVVDVGSGAVVQELDYDAWGRVLLDTSPGLQPFGFAGGLYDPATGLVRFGARDYDAETGRWTTKDPIRFGGGVNLFVYGGGDPIRFLDPTGFDAVAVGLEILEWGSRLGGASRLVGPGLTVSAIMGGILTAGIVLYPSDIAIGPGECTTVNCGEEVSDDMCWDESADTFPTLPVDPDFSQCLQNPFREEAGRCCERICEAAYGPQIPPPPGAPFGPPAPWADCARRCKTHVGVDP